MRAFFLAIAGLAALAAKPQAAAQDAAEERWEPEPGREQSYVLAQYDQSSESSDEGSGSSFGRQSLIETIVERTPEGLVLEYDLPPGAKSGFWYFPAKVLKRNDGTKELLDVVVIEARIEAWLADRDIPREVCGLSTHGGGFPFKYDCDPQSVVEEVELFDLRIGQIGKGETYEHPLGIAPVTLSPKQGSENVFTAVIEMDGEKLRASRVERELTLAQMMNEELSEQQAKEMYASTQFSGTIAMDFERDRTGAVVKRTERSKVTVISPDGETETIANTTTVARFAKEPVWRDTRDFPAFAARIP